MSKAESLLEELLRDKKRLEAELVEQKENFTSFINNADPSEILDLNSYNEYTRLIAVSRKIADINIKIRTIKTIME